MRQDHQQLTLVPGLVSARLEALKIVPDHRPNGGVGNSGGKSLELLDLRQHLEGGRHVGPGNRSLTVAAACCSCAGLRQA